MKQDRQIKKANAFIFAVLRLIFTPALYILYRFRFEKNTSKGIKAPCLILSNHQTAFDQFAVGLGFKFGLNFVASESLFRHGILSSLMKILARPIPFSKGASDFSAVRSMVSIINNGGCVAMFPSGNRSFFGDECRIVPGIGKLAKKLKCPLVLVRLCGGYNTLPRWRVKANAGKMSASVVRIVKSDELAQRPPEEIDSIIQDTLGFNEFDYNAKARIAYHGKRRAEFLESVLFYCPSCGAMGGLHSEKNDFFCRRCGTRVTINSAGFFEKISGPENIPGTVLEWSRGQMAFVKAFDFSAFTEKPVFSDGGVELFRVCRAMKEVRLGRGIIELYAEKIRICGYEFPLSKTITAVHGARKMTIYTGSGIFAVKAPERINLVKYMICGFHLRNKILNLKEEYYGY